ncbi:MAG: lactonase family protein, partial [Clostridium sp.]|nr:lactonase family protein [Clostridium sp.]
MKSYKLYVSGYSNDYAGIYQIEFNPDKNQLEVLSTNNESINPIHSLVHKNYLFTANEIDEVARISSFKIEKSGALRLINRIDGPGFGTCDITIGDD